MVDTNALLSIAFSLIANFTNVVTVPSDAVPQRSADLTKILVGSPSSPTHLYIVDHKGTEFWIDGGIVYSYRSPGSFFSLQDQSLIANYAGTTSLDSDQVVEVAAKTLQQLIKTKDPLLNETNGTPTVVSAGFHNGSRIPFFLVHWPKISRGPARGADVEVDGRTGSIVYLNLWDLAFRDSVFAKKIKDQVYTPPPKPPPGEPVSLVRKFHLPQPTTNIVSEAISNWVVFCGKLGLDLGGQTNVADVNWDRTWLYTNEQLSLSLPVSQIRFKNGACFESIGGTVFSHCSSDACFAGFYGSRHLVDWEPFTGKIVKRPADLAKNLEAILIRNFGIPESMLAPYTAMQGVTGPKMQNGVINRALMDWRNWPRNAGRTVSIDETKLVLTAEFDLETGDLKLITFRDPRFVEILHHGPFR